MAMLKIAFGAWVGWNVFVLSYRKVSNACCDYIDLFSFADGTQDGKSRTKPGKSVSYKR